MGPNQTATVGPSQVAKSTPVKKKRKLVELSCDALSLCWADAVLCCAAADGVLLLCCEADFMLELALLLKMS